MMVCKMTDSPLYPASPGPADDVPVLNPASLDQLRALDPLGGTAFVTRVLSTFQRSLASHGAGLEQAGRCGDLQALSHAAHALKSASASIGAMTLSARCAALEEAVRTARADALPGLVQAFRAEAGRVRAAVAQLLDGGSA